MRSLSERMLRNKQIKVMQWKHRQRMLRNVNTKSSASEAEIDSRDPGNMSASQKLPHNRSHFLFLCKLTIVLIVLWIFHSISKPLHLIGNIRHNLNSIPAIVSSRIFETTTQANSNAAPNESTLIDEEEEQEVLTIHSGIQIGSFDANCGLKRKCARNEFAAHIFTGFESKKYPRLCVDGKVVFGDQLNNCGRGINIAVIDNITKTLIRVSNFDTYDKDSTTLETTLLTLRPGDILIAITFDEPSSKLSYVARLLFHEMGSAYAQNLQFRSSWYLVTQKGINGYTPFEELHFPSGDGWGEPGQFRGCLPFQLKGTFVRPDKTIVENKKRKQFCDRHGDRWPLFCEGQVINDELMPSKLLHPLPIVADIMKTPIAVFTGLACSEYIPLTLETIVRQPGISVNNVIAFYDRKSCPSIDSLINVFGFRSHRISSEQYQQDSNSVLLYMQSIVKSLFRNSQQFILIDENVLLAPDFIPFFGQLLPALHFPNSNVIAINAYNENGFTNTSRANDLVYRSNHKNYSLKFAAMIKSDYLIYKKSNQTNCWSIEKDATHHLRKEDADKSSIASDAADADILIPDMSRVYFTLPSLNDISDETKAFLADYLKADINVNMEDEVLLKEVDSLMTSETYARTVSALIAKSIRFNDTSKFGAYISGNSQLPQQSFTFICNQSESCASICEYFAVKRCVHHLYIESIGKVLRYAVQRLFFHLLPVMNYESEKKF